MLSTQQKRAMEMAVSTWSEGQMPTCGLWFLTQTSLNSLGPSEVLPHTLGSCLSILSTRSRTGAE